MNQAVLSQKQAIVSEISDKMKNSDSTVVCEYRGLSVAEVTELRRNLKEENVELKVYKNTMVHQSYHHEVLTYHLEKFELLS